MWTAPEGANSCGLLWVVILLSNYKLYLIGRWRGHGSRRLLMRKMDMKGHGLYTVQEYVVGVVGWFYPLVEAG